MITSGGVAPIPNTNACFMAAPFRHTLRVAEQFQGGSKRSAATPESCQSVATRLGCLGLGALQYMLNVRVLIPLLAGCLLTGCLEEQAKPVAAKRSSASLSVTWLVPGQPPQTTNTSMSDLATCEKARVRALLAGEEARQERIRMNEQDKAEVSASLQSAQASGRIVTGFSPEQERKLKGVAPPQVSAYCVEQ